MTVGALAMLMVAFTLGMKTAKDIQPIHLINADSETLAGDIDGDGAVTKEDAIRALEIGLGYDVSTDRERQGDPNGDEKITIEDALTILKSLN